MHDKDGGFIGLFINLLLKSLEIEHNIQQKTTTFTNFSDSKNREKIYLQTFFISIKHYMEYTKNIPNYIYYSFKNIEILCYNKESFQIFLQSMRKINISFIKDFRDMLENYILRNDIFIYEGVKFKKNHQCVKNAIQLFFYIKDIIHPLPQSFLEPKPQTPQSRRQYQPQKQPYPESMQVAQTITQEERKATLDATTPSRHKIQILRRDQPHITPQTPTTPRQKPNVRDFGEFLPLR